MKKIKGDFMGISEKYLEELPINSLEAAETIIKDAIKASNKAKSYELKFKVLIPYYSLLLEIKTKISEIIRASELKFTDDYKTNYSITWSYIHNFWIQIAKEKKKRKIRTEIASINSFRERLRIHLKEEFCYSFTENEIKVIQQKVNKLRELISQSTCFAEEHKQRLLKRLERLQQELHKKVSDLDRFWGLIGDAGVMIRKFGQNAKPIVEVIKDLTNIIWGAQARAEQIEFKAMKLLDKF